MNFRLIHFYFWNINSLKKCEIVLNISRSFTINNFLIHSFYFKNTVYNKKSSIKNRSEVQSSNKKIRPQKGTGNARLGSKSSPILRGGGVIFGPKPKKIIRKVNIKEKKLALSLILFNFQTKIKILNDFMFLNFYKIKDFFKILEVKSNKKYIIFYSKANYKIFSYQKYLKNFVNVEYKLIEDLSFNQLLNFDFIYITRLAFLELNLKFLKLYERKKIKK